MSIENITLKAKIEKLVNSWVFTCLSTMYVTTTKSVQKTPKFVARKQRQGLDHLEPFCKTKAQRKQQGFKKKGKYYFLKFITNN